MARKPGPSITRRQIADASVRVLDRDGPRGFTLTAVAAALDVRAPSLYHHVDGADALRHLVGLEGWSLLVDAMPALPAAPAEALTTLAIAYRKFALERPHLYALMSDVRFDPTDARLNAIATRGFALLAGLGVQQTELVHALRGLRAVAHGFVQLELAGQFQLGIPADDSYQWLLELTLRGLALTPADA